jgi:hypothetical protein
MPPASFMCRTTSASLGALKSLRAIMPVVLGISFTHMHSLQENGTPRRGAFSGKYFSGISPESSILSTLIASLIELYILRNN